VFKKVSDSIIVRGFVSRSGVDPKANSGRGGPRVLGGHSHAIVEDAQLCLGHIQQIFTQRAGFGGQASLSDLKINNMVKIVKSTKSPQWLQSKLFQLTNFYKDFEIGFCDTLVLLEQSLNSFLKRL
jgi:hypothetical protein